MTKELQVHREQHLLSSGDWSIARTVLLSLVASSRELCSSTTAAAAAAAAATYFCCVCAIFYGVRFRAFRTYALIPLQSELAIPTSNTQELTGH